MKHSALGAPNENVGLQQTLQSARGCKQITIIQLVLYIVSFALTWYAVWWDSVISFLVALWGYYILMNEYTRPTAKHAEVLHYGSILSLVSHVIAVVVVCYYMIQLHVLQVFGIHYSRNEAKPWVLYGFLLTYLFIAIGATSVAIQRSYFMCSELARNDYYFEFSGGNNV